METIRLANMFYEQRGPLVFSASLHLVLLVGFAIWLAVSPDKEPEELVFELVPPPSAARLPTLQELQALQYEAEDVPMPTDEEIVVPERPVVKIERQPEPKPQPVEEVVEEKPTTPPQMTKEEYEKLFGKRKPGPIRKQTTTKHNIDLTSSLQDLRKNLSQMSLDNISPAQIDSLSSTELQAIDSYFARFRSALARMVDKHSFRGEALRVWVRFSISPAGRISGVSVTSSSGDAEFDRKVLQGFERLRTFEAPPPGTNTSNLKLQFVQE